MAEKIANKFVIKCLIELGIYKEFIDTVKKLHPNISPESLKRTIFGSDGRNTIDYAFTWSLTPQKHNYWSDYNYKLNELCDEHREEYDKGWIYA